jgi:hypothetical protein
MMRLKQIAFEKVVYLFFLVSVVTALALSDLPLPIFLAFVAVIVTIGVIAELLSRFASRKLSEMSTSVAPPATFYDAGAPLTALLLAFGQVEEESEFERTESWFARTAIGTFA